MIKEAFDALLPGDKVTLMVEEEGYPELGTILHRRPNWLDDGKTNCFEYDEDGIADFGFFSYDMVEKVD